MATLRIAGASWLRPVLLALCAGLVVPSQARAESQRQDVVAAGVIEGLVRDRETRQPIASATVLVGDAGTEATSNAQGRFRLAGVAPGNHVLHVIARGYTVRVQPDVVVSAGRALALVVDLDRAPGGVSEQVVVRGTFSRPADVPTSNLGMQYGEVRRSAGAIGDINRFVQAAPGVIFTNDQRNDLVTRGGSPNENLTIVDNIEVPNLNHFGAQGTGGGGISMLNVELLADASFMTGGFPAAYGNRLSSVLDVRLREGNRTRTEAEIDVNFAGAGLVVEGPLGARGSWIATVRRSYLELLAEFLEFPAVPDTTSYQFKVVVEPSARDRIWFVGIGGRDRIVFDVDEADLDDPSLERIENQGRQTVTGANWQHLFGSQAYGVLSVSRAENRFDLEVRDRQLADAVTLRNRSDETIDTLKYDVSWQMGRHVGVKGGIAYKRVHADLDVDQPLGVENIYSLDPARVNAVRVSAGVDTSIQSAHAQLTVPVAPRVKLTIGSRFDRFDALGEDTISPRAGLSFAPVPAVTISASVGRYHQQPELVYLYADPSNLSLDAMRAEHAVVGVAITPRPDLTISVEGYRKDYSRYPVSVEYPTLSLANTGDAFAVAGLLFPMRSDGHGRVEGVELLLHKRLTRRFYGQLSVTQSRTEHAAADGVLRPGAFDTPRTVSFVGGVRAGESWEFSGRYTFMSGRPYTPPLLEESQAQNRWIADLRRVSAARLESYQRLDLRGDWRFSAGRMNVSLFFEGQNALDRRNVYHYVWNPKTREPYAVPQFGFLPVFGVNVEF